MSELTASPTPPVNVVTEALFSQIMGVMGLKRPNWLTRLIYPLFRTPTKRMAGYLVEADRNTANNGWNSAVRQFTSHLVTQLNLSGEDNIPKQGPLMVICNHPAAYDVVILASSVPRDDMKIIASDIRIIQILPNISQHTIPVPYNIPSRLQTVRRAIRHLRDGGSILIFPRGNVEPDPANTPGAEQSMDGWSPSIELFLRQVPETKTVVAIASGMLSAKWFKNPLIRLWKKYEQRQKVAEIFQIASQLLTGKMPGITPTISFSPPLTISDLGGIDCADGMLLAEITRHAKVLLADHLRV